MNPRLRFLTAAALLVAAAGCENAVEHLAVDEWREVGSATSPAALFGSVYSIETLAPGRGPEVAAGDLVRVQIETSAGERVLSVWTGTYAGSDLRIVLGSAAVRALLVGRRLGERFAVRRDDSAPEAARLPVDVFTSTNEFPGLRAGEPLDGAGALDWPSFELVRDEQDANEWTLEVLGVCPAALLHRAATLRQWGYVLALGRAEIAARREGTLHWLAVEAVCADGSRRIEIGPLLDNREPLHPNSLFGWQASYSRLRPSALWGEE